MAIIFVDSTATGADDGTSWTDAYPSLNTALLAANIAPGDTVLVSGTFNETVTVAEAAAIATPNLVLGDDKSGGAGRGARATFTIDGQSTRANCLVAFGGDNFYMFRDMRCTGATSHGTAGTGPDYLTFKDCRFDNCGGWGSLTDNSCAYESCVFDNNVSGGMSTDNGAIVLACVSHTNGNGVGIDVSIGLIIGCLVYNNGTGDAITLNGTASQNSGVIGCTLDGENTGVVGIDFDGAGGTLVVVNNIIYDFTTGVDSANAWGERVLANNNLYQSNGTDRTQFMTGDDDVTGAPLFTDEAGDDYTLASGSPAKADGLDAGEAVSAASYMDIGAHQRQEPAGGAGGILVHPGMSGGMRG